VQRGCLWIHRGYTARYTRSGYTGRDTPRGRGGVSSVGAEASWRLRQAHRWAKILRLLYRRDSIDERERHHRARSLQLVEDHRRREPGRNGAEAPAPHDGRDVNACAPDPERPARTDGDRARDASDPPQVDLGDAPARHDDLTVRSHEQRLAADRGVREDLRRPNPRPLREERANPRRARELGPHAFMPAIDTRQLHARPARAQLVDDELEQAHKAGSLPQHRRGSAGQRRPTNATSPDIRVEALFSHRVA
jgi:hypothetical protein